MTILQRITEPYTESYKILYLVLLKGSQNNTLASKSRISMEQDRRGFLSLSIHTIELLCPDLPLHDGVDRVQLAGVVHDGEPV